MTCRLQASEYLSNQTLADIRNWRSVGGSQLIRDSPKFCDGKESCSPIPAVFAATPAMRYLCRKYENIRKEVWEKLFSGFSEEEDRHDCAWEFMGKIIDALDSLNSQAGIAEG